VGHLSKKKGTPKKGFVWIGAGEIPVARLLKRCKKEKVLRGKGKALPEKTLSDTVEIT